MAQSLSNIIVHMVFHVKHDRPPVRDDILGELHRYVASVATRIGCPCHAAGGTGDHVHLLCSLGRTVPACDLAEEVKKRSSKWIKGRQPGSEHFHWQAGYGVFSLGQSQLEDARRYVMRQAEHHRDTSGREEFLKLLERYRIDFDEEHLWS